MLNWIRSNILEDHTVATEAKKIDLPTNPLSFLIMTMDFYNATNEATLAEALAFINSIKVSHLGRTIVNLSSENLAAEHAYLYNRNVNLTNSIATDNAARGLTMLIPFGRKLYNPSECYPGTKKGELTLTLDTTVPSTSLDNAQINIDAVQLPGASPSHFLKSSILTFSAPGGTGEYDVELPTGNELIAALVNLTTFPSTSSHNYGIDSFSLQINDTEYKHSFAKTHCLVGEMGLKLPTLPRDIAAFGQILPANYVFLDFDPLNDSNMLIETKGAADVKFVCDFNVDEAATFVLLQRVKV